LRFNWDTSAAPTNKTTNIKITINGKKTRIQDIVLYPALQIKSKIHVQNTTYPIWIKCTRKETPPNTAGDISDSKIPANDNTKYTLEGKQIDLNVSEKFIFRLYIV